MVASGTSSLALIVRSHPYQRRSARVELDVALAALVMDFRLEVYFMGAALLQLVAEREAGSALLPAAYRGWAALPELGDVAVFAEDTWLERFPEAQLRLLMPVYALPVNRMQDGWRRCDFSMVL